MPGSFLDRLFAFSRVPTGYTVNCISLSRISEIQMFSRENPVGLDAFFSRRRDSQVPIGQCLHQSDSSVHD
jgi:hypothetical protein